MSRLALGPTQLSSQWAPGSLSLGVKWPGHVLKTHFHIVLRLRMKVAVPLLPLISHFGVHMDSFAFIFSVYVQTKQGCRSAKLYPTDLTSTESALK
jgi:hypothetical protein